MSVTEQIAAIPVELERDPHLAKCDLARRGGPDATLACAECDRAKWMHGTRHDTCARFAWVTESSLTNAQITAFRFVRGLPVELRVACARAMDDYALAPNLVRDARRTCAAAINAARELASG